MNSVGYRVKLNDYLGSAETLMNFFDEYFSLFDICEIKVNKCLEHSEIFVKCLPNIIKAYGDKLSFHINKNLIIKNQELSNMEHIILSAVEKNCLDKTYFITHLDSNLGSSYINQIVRCCNLFRENITLLLENAETNVSNIILLEQITELINELNKKEKKVGLCLDIGHLFVNEYNLKDFNEYFYQNNLSDLIYEYHIHNVKNGVAHQKLQNGIIEYEDVIKIIKSDNYFARIILEHEVEDMYKDGKENVLYLKRKF